MILLYVVNFTVRTLYEEDLSQKWDGSRVRVDAIEPLINLREKVWSTARSVSQNSSLNKKKIKPRLTYVSFNLKKTLHFSEYYVREEEKIYPYIRCMAADALRRYSV